MPRPGAAVRAAVLASVEALANVIESGTVRVTDGDRLLTDLEAGAGIGEIALLRGGPRTATVTAVTDVSASSFDAAAFLAAVGGPAASPAVTRIVEERLARSAAGA